MDETARRKKISVMVPCYNEEENIVPLSAALVKCLESELSRYDYEIVFIDNRSKDHTRERIEAVCAGNKRIKAIFNVRNFGQFNSPYYGITQCTGDCVIPVCADFQDPIEMLPRFVEAWEQGHKVVCAIKTTSLENKLMYFLRSCYYKAVHRMSDVAQIEHFTGFGLYDRSFVDIMRSLHDPSPFLRGIVAEYAPEHLEIPYQQQKRRAGKTHNNFYSLYDAAMLSFTSYTKVGLRLATFSGFFISGVSVLIGLIYLIMKLIYWDRFVAGMAPIVLGVFLLGGIELLFIGLLGEYILQMNTRIINRPLVIEDRRINFDTEDVPTEKAE